MTALYGNSSIARVMIAVGLATVFCLPLLGCGSAVGQDQTSADLPKLKKPPLFVQAGVAPQYVFAVEPGLLSEASRTVPAEMTVYSVPRLELTRDLVCDFADRVGVSVLPEYRTTMAETVDSEYISLTVIGELTANLLTDESNVGPDDKFVSLIESRVGEIKGDNLVMLDMTVTESGNFTINLRGAHPDPAGNPSTEEDALAIAERFVEQSGLLPEGCELGGVSSSAYVPGPESAGGKIESRAIARQVVYQRYLDGYPAGQFVVQVNGKDEIYYVYRNARNVTPLASYPILTAEEAIEALEDGRGSVTGPALPGARLEATIEKIKLCYDQGAAGIPYETMQPSYWIEGNVAGYEDGFRALLPAVRPEHLEEE